MNENDDNNVTQWHNGAVSQYETQQLIQPKNTLLNKSNVHNTMWCVQFSCVCVLFAHIRQYYELRVN